jgi:light-independent protochlorophyllide reductase subunit B
MMGLEDHLIMMFREDFEFNSNVPASHLGHVGAASASSIQVPEAAPYFEIEAPIVTDQEQHDKKENLETQQQSSKQQQSTEDQAVWSADALKELGKIPFFVRGKARRNTEKYANEHGMQQITLETLYDAKAYYSR